MRLPTAPKPYGALLACLFISGCSLVVKLDDVEPAGIDDDGAGSGGMLTGSGGDGVIGSGGSSSGGAPGGAGGEDGSGGDGSGAGNGSGGAGDPFVPVRIPLPYHHYHFDQSSGQTVNDRGYVKHDGTIGQAGNHWNDDSGKVGGAVYLSPPNFSQWNNNVMPPDGAYSISFWMSQESDDQGVILAKFGSTPDSGGFYLMLTDNKIRWAIGGMGNQRELDSDAVVPPFMMGPWTHVAVTYKKNASGTRDRLTMYINGEEAVQVDEPLPSHHNPYNGADKVMWASGNYSMIVGTFTEPGFSGLLDELQFFEIELTAEEVETIYRLENGDIQDPGSWDPSSEERPNPTE